MRCVDVRVAVDDRVLERVFDDARDTAEVAVTETVAEEVRVEESDLDDERVAVMVRAAVGMLVRECVDVTERDVVLVKEGVAVAERVRVDDSVRVDEGVLVIEPVDAVETVDVPEPVTV